MSTGYSEAKISQLGTFARSCITSGRNGKVLAALSKAIYMLTDVNELFWITTGDAPMHRRCAAISSPLPGLLDGSPFQVEDHRLIVEPGFIFSIDNVRLWHSPRVDPSQVLESTKLPARIHSFFSNLDISQAKGFGNFIPYILSLSQNLSVSSPLPLTDPFLSFAQPFVMDMVRACLERDPSRISKNADALIGLGSGLTPSGDDFMDGMLFAIKVLEIAYPQSKFINHTIPIESYHSRTHLISFTFLQDHASGHGISPLHEIINALLSGKSFESIYPSVLQLIQVGHSTGWDLLSGLLTGMLITAQNSYPNPDVNV